MANALTAGTFQITSQAVIAGASIAPQGTAPVAIQVPTAGATGTGQAVFSFGTASGKCDILCAADYLLTAAASVTLDLFANGLPNVFGGTANFVKLKGVFFTVLSGGDAGGVVIGGAASNANQMFFGNQNDVWSIFPSGAPLAGSSAAGVTVDGTHRNLKILSASAVDVTVRVMLAGSSV